MAKSIENPNDKHCNWKISKHLFKKSNIYLIQQILLKLKFLLKDKHLNNIFYYKYKILFLKIFILLEYYFITIKYFSKLKFKVLTFNYCKSSARLILK